MTVNGSLSDTQVFISDSNGLALAGVNKAATFVSEWFNPQGAEWLGIFVDVENGASTPNLVVTLEESPDTSDSSITPAPYPGSANTDGAAGVAALAAITTDISASAYWGNSIPAGALNGGPGVRAVFTIATGNMDIRAYWRLTFRGA